MPSAKKVSVCLPVYNGETYLAQAIESVLSQTHKNFELVIVDDASNDKSREIIQKYADKDPRIVFIKNNSNAGLFNNYNLSLQRSTGDYIKPFAQDDALEANCLDKLAQGLDSHPNASLASGARCVIDKDSAEVGVEQSFESGGIILGSEVIDDFFSTFFNRVGTPSQTMFRIKDAVSGFDPGYQVLGDIDYWLRLLLNGELAFTDDVVCKVRRHSSSATVLAIRDLSFMSDSFLLVEKFSTYLKERGKSRRILNQKLISGLIRKVRNAKNEREVVFEAVLEGNSISSPTNQRVDYKAVAQQLLLYAADLKNELEEASRTNLQQSEEYEKQIEDSEQRAQELSLELESIKNSAAWKFTEPLRKFRSVR
jgi:glycosyltransferase involved in cell wall biosynthesis